MATNNRTRVQSRKATERAAPPMEESPVTAVGALRPRTRARKSATLRPVPIHGGNSGVLSFRHRLAVHELAVVDAALAILGVHLCDPGVFYESPSA